MAGRGRCGRVGALWLLDAYSYTQSGEGYSET